MTIPISTWAQKCWCVYEKACEWIFGEEEKDKSEEIIRWYVFLKSEVKACRTEWQLKNVEDIIELMLVDKYKSEQIQPYVEKLRRIIKRMRTLLRLYGQTGFPVTA